MRLIREKNERCIINNGGGILSETQGGAPAIDEKKASQKIRESLRLIMKEPMKIYDWGKRETKS